MLSGGYPASVSEIWLPMTVTVQMVPAGRSAVGLSVMVLVPEPLTANGCRLPGVGHSMVKELADAVTGSVNGIVMLVLAATLVAPFVGVVGGATAGAASVVKVSVKLSPSVPSPLPSSWLGGSPVSTSVILA